MHTEAIEDLVEEVRIVILKLDRIACALERLTPPPAFANQYPNYIQPRPNWTVGSNVERGRSE